MKLEGRDILRRVGGGNSKTDYSRVFLMFSLGLFK